MASSNHVNYWNYLENVTANRNKEYENTRHNTETEGIGMLSATSQNLVNAANVEKIGADTKVALAGIDKIAQDIAASKANVNYQKGVLEDVDMRLVFEVDKFMQQYILDEKDVATRQKNAKVLVDRLALDWQIKIDNVDFKVMDNINRQIEQNIQLITSKERNATELMKSMNAMYKDLTLGLVGPKK